MAKKIKKPKSKFQRIIEIAFFAIVAIFVILSVIEHQMKKAYQKETAELESKWNLALENALENNDISYCEDYKQELACIVMVARQTDDISLCEESYTDNNMTLNSCKALYSGNISLCADDKFYNKDGCETLYIETIDKLTN